MKGMSNHSTPFGLESTTSHTGDPLAPGTTASRRCVHCIPKRWGRRDLHAALRLALRLAGSLSLVAETEEADAVFLRALSIGCFAGLHQVFVDGGQEMEPLLVSALATAQLPGASFRNLLPYMAGVLARRGHLKRRGPASPTSIRPSEILSAREGDILRLVGRGMSNKRIAQTLTITPETVKSHVKRIFMKLEVQSRAAAVSRAATLGLM